jgi:hypothetical protein
MNDPVATQTGVSGSESMQGKHIDEGEPTSTMTFHGAVKFAFLYTVNCVYDIFSFDSTAKANAIQNGVAFSTAIMKKYEDIPNSNGMKVLMDIPDLETGKKCYSR